MNEKKIIEIWLSLINFNNEYLILIINKFIFFQN
jgi:hypothetical protein